MEGPTDTFRKELSKLQAKKSGDGADSEMTRKWHFFKNTLFIKNQFIPCKTSGNIPDVEQHVVSQVSWLPEATCDESELHASLASEDMTEIEDSGTSPSHTKQPSSELDIKVPSKRKKSNEKDIALQKMIEARRREAQIVQTTLSITTR